MQASPPSVHHSRWLETLGTFGFLQNMADIPSA
jgi:hypothetical protein